MFIPVILAMTLAGSVGAATAPPIPAGLWQNRDDGFVVRIDACGEGFCGFAVGAPAAKRSEQPEVCGWQMLEDFRWKPRTKRWEGRLRPPGTTRSMGSSVVSDGLTFLNMKARMLVFSKTMSLVPFTGKIGERCSLE